MTRRKKFWKSEYLLKKDKAENSYYYWIREHEKKECSGKKHALISLVVYGQAPLSEAWELFDFDNEQMFSGEYIAYMQMPGILAPNALDRIEELLQPDGEKLIPDLIYSDEDFISEIPERNIDRFRHNPFMKPDWSPDTLESFFYLGGLVVIKKEIAKTIPMIPADDPKQMVYEFLRAYSQKAHVKYHIPEILYHRCDSREYPYLSTKKGKDQKLVISPYEYSLPKILPDRTLHKISIVILSKDNIEMLQTCIKSLREYMQYDNHEIIVVDNGSTEENRNISMQMSSDLSFQYLYEPMEFWYSKLCNIGAAAATGDYLLFMNDDVEVRSANGFMKRMARKADEDHVGAVGIKLLYPDEKIIQHVGITNLQVGPSHKLATYEDEKAHYFGRNRVTYNVLAVTGACLMVARNKFYQVGGFDERLHISYTDVDLCVDLLEKGYYNLVLNDIYLCHHESVSRGNDSKDTKKLKRLMEERDFFYEKHSWLGGKDPFYNQNLTGTGLDYSLDYKEEWENVSRFPKMDLIQPADLYPASDKAVRYSIDAVRMVTATQKKETDYFEIEGWMLHGKKDNCFFQKYVVLSFEDKGFLLEAADKYRPDVEEIFPKGKKVAMSGFVVRVDKTLLNPSKSYGIGIAMRARNGGKYLYKETEWKIKN